MRFLRLAALLTLLPGLRAQEALPPPVQMLLPGFTVEELPVKLSNQNNLRFAPDGTLTSLGYDGRIWRLRDTDGDGLEDRAEPYWDQPTLSVPLGMAWSSRGLYVSSKGKVSLLRDTDGDGKADAEEIVTSGWPPTDVGSGGVDATAVTLDEQGKVYFGLLVADYSNAYRLRARKDLKPAEIQWLKEHGRWREPAGPEAAEDQFSLYDLQSSRGTIQKFDPRTKERVAIATGIRVPVALAFNRARDLFNTDQEGETWMPNGNPLDELNHIVAGRNYGFPPRHDQWLPDLVSEPPVVAFGPQHQSSCGLVFNEPHPPIRPASDGGVPLPASAAQGLFGPPAWEGNAFVAGESRGKIWRVRLVKTPSGYAGKAQTIARLPLLTLDVAISPRGELYVCCHSGQPDWGTGPQGEGRIFKISYKNPSAPMPAAVWPASATEVRVNFEKPVDAEVLREIPGAGAAIEFGEYVSAGDRFEILKPPYAVVQQQDAVPRGHLGIRAARLEDGQRTLVLETDPHPLAVRYALTLARVKAMGAAGSGQTIDLDYDLTPSSQPLPADPAAIGRAAWSQPLAWAPKARASGGTDSRAAQKPDGDWQRGRDLFSELQCIKCHRTRGEGGIVGPDLSNLIHRDPASVLRDIREPSATLHPDYVTYQVTTRDGETVQGFIRSQTADALKLFDAEGKESTFPRNTIDSVRPTGLSLMPAGLIEGRSETDVRDLLTFLLWAPPQRSKEWTRTIRSGLDPSQPSSAPDRDLRLILVASKQDHGPDQHDYPRWQTNWASLLHDPTHRIEAHTAWEWPTSEQLESADVLIFYFWNHDWSPARLDQIDRFLARGGGLVLMHAAVIADKDPELLARRIGLSAQPGRTGYRHMPFDLVLDRSQPLTQSLPEVLDLLDEPYWPMIGEVADVQLVASAKVDGKSRPLIWTREAGRGRIFASVLGHYTATWSDPAFRLLMFRGIAWAARENPSRLEGKALEGSH